MTETETSERPSRLTLFQLGALLAALLLVMVGSSRHMPALLLVAGLLFAAIGAASWMERRLALSEAAGEIRRRVLGRHGIVRSRLRAALWLLFGMLLIVK